MIDFCTDIDGSLETVKGYLFLFAYFLIVVNRERVKTRSKWKYRTSLRYFVLTLERGQIASKSEYRSGTYLRYFDLYSGIKATLIRAGLNT